MEKLLRHVLETLSHNFLVRVGLSKDKTRFVIELLSGEVITVSIEQNYDEAYLVINSSHFDDGNIDWVGQESFGNSSEGG